MACPVCDDSVTDGELCPAHRALAEREPPERLVKLMPPKPDRQWWERGHTVPDFLYVMALLLFIVLMLYLLGVRA